MLSDAGGQFWDYVLDGIFIVLGIIDLVKEPSWSKAGWLLLDVVLAIIPAIPAISSVRHLGKVDDVIDVAKAIDKIDDMADTVKVVNQFDNVNDTLKVVNQVDNVTDTFNALNHSDDVIDTGKEIGTYLLKNANGDVIYVGKGSRNRMMKNFKRFNASSSLYYPAKNVDMAFANEAYFMAKYGGALSMNPVSKLLNKINSPGLKRLFYWF